MSKLEEKLNDIWDTAAPSGTKRVYQNQLDMFYDYSNILKNLHDLIACPPEILQKELEGYCDHMNKRVKIDEISANSVEQRFTGIKNALDNNYRENDIKWKPIKSKCPAKVRRSGYRPYSNLHAQKILLKANTSRNRALVLFDFSTGSRVGIHDHPLLVKHTVMMSSTFDDNHLDCMAVLLYADRDIDVEEMDMRDKVDDESRYNSETYWGFLTPEATIAMLNYWNERKKDGEIFTPDTPIFRQKYQIGMSPSLQIRKQAVVMIMDRIVKAAKIPRVKKGRRFDIQLNHGKRKRFNTELKMNDVVNSNAIEKMMAHKNGLDGTYLHPTREKLFKEFVKGIHDLTIDDSARKQSELDQKEKENNELKKKIDEIKELKQKMDGFEKLKQELRDEFKDEIKNLKLQ